MCLKVTVSLTSGKLSSISAAKVMYVMFKILFHFLNNVTVNPIHFKSGQNTIFYKYCIHHFPDL